MHHEGMPATRRALRISFILPTVNMSGGIRVVAIYAKALQDMGHTVQLVSPPAPGPSFREAVRSLIQGRWPWQRKVNPSHLDGLGVPHTVLSKPRPVDDQDIPNGDIVIATWWETAEWVNALSSTKGRKVYFVQHHEIFDNLPYARCRATYTLPLQKITIAQWLVEVMREQYGDSDVALIPNSVDHTQFFAPPRGKQSVPTVGFLFHDAAFKGVDITLDALARVKQRIPQLRVICFGSHPPSANQPLPEYVEFHHEPAQQQIREIYAACDVWVTSSRSEGFNLTAMEAMACRCPVVSTKTGWPAEAVVNYKNGILTEVNDMEAIATGLEWILGRDAEQWRELSNAAFDTVRESSWQRSAQLFEQALLQCANQPPRTATPSPAQRPQAPA